MFFAYSTRKCSMPGSTSSFVLQNPECRPILHGVVFGLNDRASGVDPTTRDQPVTAT
jgi:hypothetical protein